MATDDERTGETRTAGRPPLLFLAAVSVGLVAILLVASASRGTTTREQGREPGASAVAIVAVPAPSLVASPSPSAPTVSDPTFKDRLHYEVRSTQDGQREFCTNLSRRDLIVLGHIMGCADEAILMQPSHVDCGSIHGRPTAAQLATVLLEHPGLGAVDLGPIGDGSVPAELFRDLPTGRVVDLPAKRSFDPSVDDPDVCRLTAEDPGDAARSSVTDIVEIRADVSARYVLFDTSSGLVVVGVSLGGHDGPTARAGHARGYGSDENRTIEHMLEQIYDIALD